MQGLQHKPTGPLNRLCLWTRNTGRGCRTSKPLLNAIDRSEIDANAQTGLNLIAALPKLATDEDRARIVRDFGREEFLRQNIPAVAHIHGPHEHDHEKEHSEEEELTNNGNHHVHFKIGLRTLGPDGQFGDKYLEWGSYREFLEHKRERWAELGARYLEKAQYLDKDVREREAERWRYGHLKQEAQHQKAVERGDREWAEKKSQGGGQASRAECRRDGAQRHRNRPGERQPRGRAAQRGTRRNQRRTDLAKQKAHPCEAGKRQDAFDNLKHEMSEAAKVLDIDRMLAADLLKLADSDPARFEKQWQTARNIPGVVAALEGLKIEQQRQEDENRQRELADLDKFLAAELHEQQKKYPNHFRTHRKDQIPPPIAAEMEKLAAADAKRKYAQHDPAKEQIAWEDAVAKAAIEKERKERQFVEPAPSRPAGSQRNTTRPAPVLATC